MNLLKILYHQKSFFYWTLNISWTASYEITLVCLSQIFELKKKKIGSPNLGQMGQGHKVGFLPFSQFWFISFP